jgi:hypothetical protein
MVLVGLSFSLENNRVGFAVSWRLKFFKFYFSKIRVFHTKRGLPKGAPPRIVEADPSKSPTANDPADLTEYPNPVQIQPEDV